MSTAPPPALGHLSAGLAGYTVLGPSQHQRTVGQKKRCVNLEKSKAGSTTHLCFFLNDSR